MKASMAVKKNLSSMQVLKTLQVLLEDNYSMTDLIKKLNASEDRPVFNHSIVSKYINTCRYLGIEIPKIHNKYFVASMPFGLDLTARELELLDKLQSIAIETLNSKSARLFDGFLKRLSKYSNKQILRVEDKTKQETFDVFERAIREKRKISLMLRGKTVLECIPLAIVEKKGKTFFSINYDDKDKLISVDKVLGIELLFQRFMSKYSNQVVVYKLTGNLAKRYELRENEQIMNRDENEIVISNKDEDKRELFSRLLRYDSNCEILHPKSYRDDMKKLLEEMLGNYGV